ncbi:MAG: hypothetical protein RL095_1763 [Verrucomicrobiota bacterium]|jgi:hypothetical protein
MSNTFTNVDDRTLCEVISTASNRLVFIAPGLRPEVASALVEAMDFVPVHAIHLVLDVDAEVCRLGYGDAEFRGFEILQEAAQRKGLTVNHHPGIRIGMLIADETTLIYSPTPELIEAGSHQVDKPNGIILHNQLPEQLANACALGGKGFETLEVGKDAISVAKVDKVKQDLANAPPKEFNVARIERVFSSMLQYIELTIENYKLNTRSLNLDSSLLGVQDADVLRRLKNKYNLFSASEPLEIIIPRFDKDGNIDDNHPGEIFSPQVIDQIRNELKKKYFIEVPNYGNMILIKDIKEFESELDSLKLKIEFYQHGFEDAVNSRADKIVNELLLALKDRLKDNIPDRWRSRILFGRATDEDIERLFREDIESELFRIKKEIVPEVRTVYKALTYQTFQDNKFRSILDKRFGKNSIDRILNEHDAAPALINERQARLF